MMKRAAILVLLSGFGLAGCGFQPVYSPTLSAAQAPIQIEEIPGRAGHELRQALILETRSGLSGAPEGGGTIVIDLKESILRTGFNSDGTAFRATLRLEADYVADLGETAISGRQSAETSYDVADAPFADIQTQNDVAARVARDLARRIVTDMTLRLSQDG